MNPGAYMMKAGPYMITAGQQNIVIIDAVIIQGHSRLLVPITPTNRDLSKHIRLTYNQLITRQIYFKQMRNTAIAPVDIFMAMYRHQ